eukprot:6487491-Prymnesium_polylepis.2
MGDGSQLVPRVRRAQVAPDQVLLERAALFEDHVGPRELLGRLVVSHREERLSFVLAPRRRRRS